MKLTDDNVYQQQYVFAENGLPYEHKTLMTDCFDENDCKNIMFDYHIGVHTEWLNFIIVIQADKLYK